MPDNNLPPMHLPPNQSPLPAMNITPVGYDDVEISQTMHLRDYLYILIKRKWWIIGTFLAIFLGMLLYTTYCTRIYRSSSTLQITQDSPGSQVSANEKLNSLGMPDPSEKFQNTQYKILKSYSLAQRIVQTLNLKDYAIFKNMSEDSLAKLVSSNIEVTPVRNSYLVQISFESPDKSLSQRVVNAVTDEYMYLSIDRRNESFVLVAKWLDKQLQQMASKVEQSQQKLFKFAQQSNIYNSEDNDNVVIKKFTELSALLTKAQTETLAKRAQYQQIQEKGTDAPLIVNNGMIAVLRQQLVTQQAKISALRKVFRKEHPDIIAEQATLAELQGRLQAEVRRLQESIKADYETASRTEKFLSDSLAAQKEQVAKLQDNLTGYQILKRDAQTNEQLYQALLARVKEANIASTMVPTNVAIIDPARLPKGPYKPQTLKLLSIAAIMGLILGISMAFLVEFFDDSIKSTDDIEKFCKLPSIGILPMITPQNGRRPRVPLKWEKGYLLPRLADPRAHKPDQVKPNDSGLIICQDPNSIFSEAIRHTYSSLMLSASGKPPSVVLVCSANPSEGKSTVISNLAQSCAQNGRATVLVDCDMRKPTIHNIFKINLQPGLSNYLSGGATLEEILHTSFIPNLTIIPAGVRPPNPINLIHSEIFEELLNTLRQQYQNIFIDTPPVLGFADARFVSVLADGVLLVYKSHGTNKDSAFQAQQAFTQIHARLFGAVLNYVNTSVWGSKNHYYNTRNYYKYYNVKN